MGTGKGAYGKVKISFVSNLFDAVGVISRGEHTSELPKTFEMLDQSYGFMIYSTEIPKLFTDPALLEVAGLRDRGYVFLDEQPVGILSRSEQIFSLPLQTQVGQKLSIVVENMGR